MTFYYKFETNMISFTHNPSKSVSHYQYEHEQQYEPLIITNAGSGKKQQQMPEPARAKKMLVKAHSNSRPKNSISRTQKPVNQKKTTTTFENVPWNSQAATKTVLYDNYLKKDSLAAQERKLRAQERIKENGKHKEREGGRTGNLMEKQEEIQRRKIEIVTKQQEKQIVKLKQLIEKQRLEKQKNDMEYEQKKRRIEAERRQLIDLQKQIQKQGPKALKQVKQKIKGIEPGFDRIRLKETLSQQNPKNEIKTRTYQNYAEITQSESIANQKNMIRQQQLDYLVGQRQKNYQQYQKNTLGYTPTLIPLLSRASYKIISTHISSLVQLFIDDLLEEQVYLLEAIQLEARAEQEKQKQKEMLSDYVRKLEDFVDQTEQIEDKSGKYSKMKFQQIYKFPSKTNQLSKTSQSFNYRPDLFMKLELRLNNDEIEEIEHRVDRFKRYVSSFDQYKRDNLEVINKLTEDVINQAIHKLAKELDEGAGEFVNIVFRNQFQ